MAAFAGANVCCKARTALRQIAASEIRVVITLPLNVALNFALMRSLGVSGIALSTSLVFLTSCCYLMLSVHRALRIVERS